MNDRLVFWLLLYATIANTLLLAYLAWRTWRDHRPSVSSLTFHFGGDGSPISKQVLKDMLKQVADRRIVIRTRRARAPDTPAETGEPADA